MYRGSTIKRHFRVFFRIYAVRGCHATEPIYCTDRARQTTITALFTGQISLLMVDKDILTVLVPSRGVCFPADNNVLPQPAKICCKALRLTVGLLFCTYGILLKPFYL